MPNRNPYVAQELLSHQAFLRRLAIDLAGEDADDLVQEVWRRALERPPHHGRQLRGWLARVTRNLAANRWRDEARRRSLEERRDSELPAEEELEARLELRKQLVEALDCLSPSCRATVLLRYFEGLAPRDIASRQRVPVATVKKRLQRGLGQLREALDQRYDGDRASWMSAITALAVPVESGVGTGTLVIGGMAMGTMMKVSAAVLVVAAGVYFVTPKPQAESARMETVEPPATDTELVDAAPLSAVEGPATKAGGRSQVAEEPPAEVTGVTGTNVLRVILEGSTERDAAMASVTVNGVEEGNYWPNRIRDSWPCLGSTSEFDLDPFFARLAERGNLRDDELVVEVDHPEYFIEAARVPLSSGVEGKSGQTVYEVRVRWTEVVFWSELTLAVRDANTRAHLEDVELRCVPTSFMAAQLPGSGEPYTSLGRGLSSPIVMRGGRKANEPEDRVAGLAVGPASGEAPQLAELSQPVATDRGVLVYARAPGYTWGTIVLDVSTGAERELLLKPAATLGVRMANVQLQRYAALEAEATLVVVRPRTGGGEGHRVWSQQLDETLESEGMRLENLEPGEYAVSVVLPGASGERPVLAHEELSLAANETRELVLVLADPRAPPERATLGGVVSFPTPTASWGEERVRLQLYEAGTYRYGGVDVELSLADLGRVGGALPTWAFRLEDLPVGLYQLRLWPLQTSWMIELPAGGREDVELVIPELAEALVETVDARTGERIPIDEIGYRGPVDLPGQVKRDWVRTHFEGEPGRFRFWTAPGAVSVRTYASSIGLDYDHRLQEIELVPGLQSVRFEFAPVCALRFELRVNGATLPHGDATYFDVLDGVGAVEHEGRVTPVSPGYVRVSTPGPYEINFEGVGADRFLPIPPRRVDVREGETAEVVVELRQK